MALEARVKALENRILSHCLNVPYQRNQRVLLENVRWYDDIIIKQADRGCAVVVIDRDAYEKAGHQMSDSNVYTPLDENTTEAMVQEINERIQESFNEGNIDERTRDYRLASKDARPGRFYLLPTLHKQGVPGRPVISGFSTPTEKISEFVDLLTAETFGTKHRVIH